MKFSEQLRALRLAESESYRFQLAKKLGVSTQALYYWETGRRKPRKKQLEKLEKYFNVKFEL